ncbi:MAG: hypothetical protein ABIP97_06760 [Chthoniobacterales bacterium]
MIIKTVTKVILLGSVVMTVYDEQECHGRRKNLRAAECFHRHLMAGDSEKDKMDLLLQATQAGTFGVFSKEIRDSIPDFRKVVDAYFELGLTTGFDMRSEVQ